MGRRSKNSGDELMVAPVAFGLLYIAHWISTHRAEIVRWLPWAVLAVLAIIVTVIWVSLSRKRRSAAGSTVAATGSPTLQVAAAEPRLARHSIRDIDWFQFERLMELVFSKEGYRVERRGGAHPDGGVDLVLIRGIERIAVQCKHWNARQAGVKVVREFLGAMAAGRFDSGIFVISNEITQDARELAAANRIQLLDRKGLDDLMARHNATYDPEFLEILSGTDKRCPRCESKMVQRVSQRGANIGKPFWGCSTFPKCRYVMPGEVEVGI